MVTPRKRTWTDLLAERGDPLPIYADLLSTAWQTVRARVTLDDERLIGARAFERYANEPVTFVRDILGQRLWNAQSSILRTLHKRRRVVVRSCRKAGKTHTAADAVLWAMATGETIVVTTAPTHTQVRNLLWGQIGKAFAASRARLPGELSTQAWRVTPSWYAVGVSVNRPENLLGYHGGVIAPDGADPFIGSEFDDSAIAHASGRRATEGGSHDDDVSTPLTEATVEHESGEAAVDDALRALRDSKAKRILFVLDEAPGVGAPVWDAMEGSIVGDHAYVLAQGNPTMDPDSDHPFARACRPGSGWFRFLVAARRFPEEWDGIGADASYYEVPPWLLAPGWVEARAKEWGEDSPLFRSYVLGLFSSPTLERQFIPARLLYATQDLELPDDGTVECRHIGVDLAAGGGDWCVASLNIGGALAAEHRWRIDDLMRSVGVIVELMREWGVDAVPVPARNVHVDATGLGRGVTDRLRQLGYYVDAVDFGSAARYDWRQLMGETRCLNRKAELHWIVRRALEEHRASIPQKYREVRRQAQWATYELRDQGRNGTVVACAESKDDLRARYGRSPDEWDAWMLSWSRAAAPRDPVRFVTLGQLGRPSRRFTT